MKTIDEVVEGKTLDELKTIARTDFTVQLMKLRNTLIRIHCNVIIYRSDKLDSLRSLYKFQKEKLEKKDLWDERYDKYLEDASKGQLNTEELCNI